MLMKFYYKFIYSIILLILIGFCYYFSMRLIEKNKGAEAPLGIFGNKAYLPRGGYAARRTSPKTSSLAFIVLLDLQSSPTVLSTRLMIRQSIPCRPLQKNTDSRCVNPIISTNITSA